jgi:hypothetical protein
MKLKFCTLCKNLCIKKIINNKLQLECANCKSTDNQITENDTILYDFNYKNDNNISNKLLKNIANDQISLTLNKECPHCKKPYIKQYVSENLEKTINICSCLF